MLLLLPNTDKLKKQEIERNLARFQEEMLKHWEELPTYFVTSAEKKVGRGEVLDFIDNINKQFYEYYQTK